MNQNHRHRCHPILPSLAACLAASIWMALAPAHAAIPARDQLPRDQLQRAAQAWVSELTPGARQSAIVQHPEARIEVKACGSWQFDLPFGPGQGLRARCGEPRQQVFLTLEHRVERPGLNPVATLASEPKTAASPAEAPRLQAVVVAKQAIRPLQPAQTAQFEIQQREVPAHFSGPVLSLEELAHQQLTRPLKEGDIVLQRDLRPSVLVKRGQVVTVSIQPAPGLVITARLEAQEDGRIGQSIRFRNPQSGRILNATVIGPGEAKTT